MEDPSTNAAAEASAPATVDATAPPAQKSQPEAPQQQPTIATAHQPEAPKQQPSTEPAKPSAPAAAPQPRRPQVAPRDRFNHQSLGISLNSNVKQARVLMVGAGGIGCELLKNLVLSGFGEIHVVDLDTIDLSNLNRQFLFRHEHIKKSKALVAKDAAQKFNPNVKIISHHANIKDAQFSVAWFRGFKLVYNALDNLEARRHVNKMCLAADIPLVESGTTGFNGQVQVIKKGVTACYDCTPKEAPKSFPVCTIRSTPSQPIHCIVWGKSYLLNEVFGTSEDQSAFDHSEDAENANEIAELKQESEALKKIREAIGTPEFPKRLFDKVFNADIERLRNMEDMWKSRRAPESLKYDELIVKAKEATENKAALLADDQKIWSLEQNLVVFNDSLERLSQRMFDLKKSKKEDDAEPVITFDKDDQDTLDFVTAAANFRSSIFGIDLKSRFDVKQMAGNIIPAIATTNAIVAGLCVLQSFKVLKGDFGQAREVFLTPFAPQRLLAPDRLREPNPGCPVCSVFNVTVTIDPSRTTLDDLVEGLLKKHLGMGEKEFSLNNDVGVLYDPEETDNLPKKLSELGIKDGSFLTIIDDDDYDTWVNIVVNIEENTLDENETFKASCAEQPEVARKPQKKPEPAEPNGHKEQNGDDAVIIEEHAPKTLKRSNPDDGEQPAKKAKIAASDSAIDLDKAASGGGAIVIDDD